MLRVLFISLFLSFYSSFSWSQAFSTGNEFQSVRLMGTIYLTCYGWNETRWATVHCDRDTLDPVEMDYFLDENAPLLANKVELKNTHNNDRVVKKSQEFLPNQKHTRRHVNLWVWSLTQRPLLDMGLNNVQYEYFNGRESLGSGEFEVMVHDGGSRQCRSINETSNNVDDCRAAGQSRCLPYFQRENWCQ